MPKQLDEHVTLFIPVHLKGVRDALLKDLPGATIKTVQLALGSWEDTEESVNVVTCYCSHEQYKEVQAAFSKAMLAMFHAGEQAVLIEGDAGRRLIQRVEVI